MPGRDNRGMADLLLLFIPFFALVLLGWAAARGGLVPLEGIGALNSFVLYFGLSAMVFRLGASGALHQAGLASLLLAYGVAGFAVAGLALAWSVRQGLTRLDGGLAALATAFPNTGFLGLPLLTGLLGPQAAGPVAATLVVDVLVLSSLCLAWAHSRRSPDAQGRRALASAFKGALRNPLLWAMAAGMLVAETQAKLPHPLDETLRLLGLSATPAALFTLGAMLARAAAAKRSAPGTEAAARAHPVWLPALFKLALHPALVWSIGQALPAVGVSVPRDGLLVLTMAAALPSASNVSMLAEREGASTALVARIILWTTAAALISLAFWARLLGVHPAAGT
ncbi:MAG: AEC family transporter [Rubrivivax sp.]|nr:MAG: AEC family transporter [Rubrivivax sp.]